MCPWNTRYTLAKITLYPRWLREGNLPETLGHATAKLALKYVKIET